MATSTRERREEYSSNVVRTLSPTRPLSPGGNMSDIDTKLDYLLEDLQSTVSGDSAYSSHRKENPYGTASRDMQYLAPANTTTVIRERSRSPTSTSERVYKQANYQYSSSTAPTSSYSSQQNASQLDTLLQDLKSERDYTRDRDISLVNDISLDSSIEPGSTLTKTTRVYSSSSSGKPSVHRELVFDSPNSSTLRSSGRAGPKSPTYVKTIESKTIKDVSYDAVAPQVETIRTNTLNRYNYSSDTSRERAVSPYSKTVTVDSSSPLPLADLKKVPLSDDILPVPGTKVTTTVRTYTYEIPTETPATTTKTLLYKNETHNSTNTTYPPPTREVPSSVVFKTESYNTVDTTDGYPPYREPSVSPIPPSTTTRTVIHKKDTSETTNTVYPGSPGYPTGSPGYPTGSPGYPTGTNRRPREASPQPGPNTTIIYKENITNTNVNQYPPNNWSPTNPSNQHLYPGDQVGPPARPAQPVHPGQPGYPAQPSQPGHPGQPGPTQTYIYKYESSNTTNTLYGPPGSGKPNNQTPTPIITYPNDTLPRSPQSPRSPGYPNEPGSVTYKYSTHTSTRNTHGTPSEREPLLQPAPFPVDGLEPQSQVDGPPKRLDDLLATLGNGPNPNGNALRDEPYTPRKEVETGVATGKSLALVESKSPSKNVAGPPVYYPPGHEMFARKEEGAAAYRAQGGWARGSGRYEYESESRSKTKSKSGATMIPVCLPLCCAMPCSIM